MNKKHKSKHLRKLKNIHKTRKDIVIRDILKIIQFKTKLTTSFGMQHYYNVDFSTGLVTASSLNVRNGLGTNYPIVTRVNKN